MFKKVFFVSLSFFIITGCAHNVKDTDQPQAQNKREIPQLTLEDFEGDKVSISELNKPSVINSWAGWCAFCKEELKAFAKAKSEFGNRVKIIAINRGEPKQEAIGYTDDLGVTNKLTFLLDPDDKFYRKIGGFSMPETIFVNSKGKIVFHKRGPMDAEEIKKKIKEHLLDK